MDVSAATLNGETKMKLDDVLTQATACRQSNQPAEALRLLDEALKEYPDFFPALRMKAVFLLELERFPEAVQCCDAALLSGGNDFFSLARGMAFMKLEQEPEALEAFSRALDQNPRNTEALRMKLSILLRTGQMKESLACFDEVLARCPDLAYAREGRNRLLLSMGGTEAVNPSASQQFHGVVSSDLAVAIRKGRELVLAKKKKEAVAWFDELIAKNPASDQLLVEKGIAVSWAVFSGAEISLYDPADVHAALRCFEQAATLNPRCINAYVMQGRLYNEVLDFNAAHASLDKALAIDPNWVPALLNKAMTCAEAARFGEAIEYCDRCLRMSPGNTDARNLRARYTYEAKKSGTQEPLQGVNFREQFSVSRTPQPHARSGQPAPAAGASDIDIFHERFTRCCGRATDGSIRVEPDCLRELVMENPDIARRYLAGCCSEPSIPRRSLELVSSIGILIQVAYGDSGPLERILQRLQEIKGK